MIPTFALEPVIDCLPAGFDDIRAEARADGYLFLERLLAEWNAQTIRFDHDGEVLLAARVDDVLAAIGGLTLDPVVVGALRMRRFYVRPSFRRQGIGYRLVGALLELSRHTGRTVMVNAALGSSGFWEGLGFVADKRDGHTHILLSPPPTARHG